jgi:hypothetical protein
MTEVEIERQAAVIRLRNSHVNSVRMQFNAAQQDLPPFQFAAFIRRVAFLASSELSKCPVPEE